MRVAALVALCVCVANVTAGWVAVSHPFGNATDVYELLALDASHDGVLSRPNPPITFRLTTATQGVIAFVSDAHDAHAAAVRYGVVSGDDGTVGVFGVDDATGAVHVVAYGLKLKNGCYASGLSVSRGGRGHTVFVLDSDVAGGVCALQIRSGQIVEIGVKTPWKSPAALVFLHPERAVAIDADDADGAVTAEQELAVVVGWGAAVAVVDVSPLYGGGNITALATGAVWNDTQAIVSAACVTADQRFLIAADDNAFSDFPPRVGVAELLAPFSRTPAVRSAVQSVAANITDPSSLQCAPFRVELRAPYSSALVVEGEANAFARLQYDADHHSAQPPLSGPFAVPVNGAAPQLPTGSVLIGAGDGAAELEGLVFVAEVSGVRRVRFARDQQHAASPIEDLGVFDLGPDLDDCVGAVGVNVLFHA